MKTNLEIPDCYLIADFKFIPPEPRKINLFEYLRCKNGSLVVGLQDGRMLEYDGEDMEIHIFNSKEIYFKDIGCDCFWQNQAHITDPDKKTMIVQVFSNFNIWSIDTDNIYIFEH